MFCTKTLRRACAWIALLCVLFPFNAALAADFAGTGTGAIPDNNSNGLTVSFPVSGIAQPLTNVRIALNIDHTWTGDLEATLTSPGGKAHLLLFGRSGRTPTSAVGYGANLLGTYLFDDGALADWRASLQAVPSGTLAPGRYRTTTGGTSLSRRGGCSTSLGGAFAGLSGADVNGTWTLKIADLGSSDTGSISAATLTLLDDQLFSSAFEAPVRGACTLAQSDFTGSGRTSYTLARPNGSVIEWIIQDNDGTTVGAQQFFTLGNPATDYVLAGDFDGDGIADPTVWNAGTEGSSAFRVRRSSRPSDVPLVIVFGKDGDDPTQVGDYDGDGIDDVAVYREGALAGDPSSTLIRLTATGAKRTFTTGENPSFPTGGVDYTGDGVADISIQSTGANNTGRFRIYDGRTGVLSTEFTLGQDSDFVVPGNYIGSNRFDVTVRRSTVGDRIHITRNSDDGLVQPDVHWGILGDFSIPGDYDGDGFDDYAIWRASTTPGQSFFYIRPSSNTANPITLNLGQDKDYAVAGFRVH